ncbi:MAG TPA: choice-of-anchor B family protein, partial [Candidatus Eisenbacteria bacterium]|nr:choice-of-anchor B family protein [Candidatus Eisenbacteria bacterium]
MTRLTTPSYPRWTRTLLVLALLILGAEPASAQQSRNVTLLSHMDLYSMAGYSSCWSYIHSDGREYAVEFSRSGASIVRLADPQNPVEVAFFNLPDSEWHEGRQYQHYFYITTEFVNNYNPGGLTILDMADPEHPRRISNFDSPILWSHTIEIDTARGFLYTPGAAGTGPSGNIVQGLFILSLANPENPTVIAVYGDEAPNYTHTIHVRGTRGYASMQNQGTVRILDLTNPAQPSLLAEIQTPAGVEPGGDRTLFRRTHSAWESADERFLYVSDETSPLGVYVYDIQNLANIQRVYTFEGMPPRSIGHDPVVRGNRLFLSYYTTGARVYDISNPAWPVEIGYYDTYDGRDGGFHGCWEVAPLFPSGIFVASDMETGLYVFRLDATYGIVRGTVRKGPNGPPVAGALVRQAGSSASTVSFSDGRYALAVTPGSNVTLNTTLFGYDPLSKSLAVTAGSDRPLDLPLRASDAGSISGVVRGTPGSPTLNEAELEITG